MKKNINKESIKKLLENGFDKNLIAFELDVPVEDIERLSDALEAEEQSKSNLKEKTKKEDSKRMAKREKAKNELEELRENYRKAYFASNNSGIEVFDDLSKTEKALINSSLVSTEKILDEMPEYTALSKSSAEKYQRRAGARAILGEIAKIQNYPLSIEIAETFYYLLQSQKIKELNTITDQNMDENIARVRGRMILRLGFAINYAAMQTDDIDELQNLMSKITLEMIKENPIAISSISSRISAKITRLKQEEFKRRNKERIPDSINEIVKAVANGSLDIEKANKTIEMELNKSDTKYDKEQERKQYLIYIADSLMSSANRYYITSPEVAIQKIQELSNGERYKALRIVVTNLLERKEFSRAKELCQKLLEGEKNGEFAKKIINLQREIKNKEFGEFVLNVINEPMDYEKEQQYLEYIKAEISMGKIKPNVVQLGKTQDGVKNITLADVLSSTINVEF